MTNGKTVWSQMAKILNFQTFRGVRQGSVLTPTLFSMVMDKIIIRKRGQKNGLPKIIVYTYDIVV
jgi:hypothetical protein